MRENKLNLVIIVGKTQLQCCSDLLRLLDTFETMTRRLQVEAVFIKLALTMMGGACLFVCYV